MKALTYLIRLVEPLLTTQAKIGEANSAVAYPFIPGSIIRGALVGRFLNGQAVDALDEKMQQLFLNGKVRYLNAYPAHPQDCSRSLPKPLSWFIPKEDASRPDAPVFDFAVHPQQWDGPAKPPQRGDFYWLHALAEKDDETGEPLDLVELYTPAMQVTVHNFSKSRNRKDESLNEVYRYDAIAADEVFSGVIIADDETLLTESIQPLLEGGDLLLGRSCTGGYGRVQISDVNLRSAWWEYPADEIKEPPGAHVRLTCLSDVILRNAKQHILKELEDLAGAKLVRSHWRSRLTGGFNRKWGLPLLQAWTIQAGSVFVFPGECKTRLEQFIDSGLGERRGDGYGRIALSCDQRSKLLQRETPQRESQLPDLSELTAEERELLELMANRQLQARLDDVIKELVNSDTARLGSRLPSPAQLSRARLAARRAWLKNDLSEIIRHFQGLSKTTVKTEWDGARIGDQNLQRWLVELVENKGEFNPVAKIPGVAGVTADFEKLRDRTLARRIEGVLKRAVKEAKKKAEGGEDEQEIAMGK